MAKILNQTGATKYLLEKLHSEKIKEFTNVKSILDYKKNWKSDVENKFNSFRDTFIKSNEDLKDQISKNQKKYDQSIEEQQKRYNDKLERLERKAQEYKEYSGGRLFSTIKKVQLYFCNRRISYLKKHYIDYIYAPYSSLKSLIKSKENKLNYNRSNYNDILNDKKEAIERNAKRILTSIDKCKNELSGAIGEEKAIKELEKLSGDYIVINDFKLKFNRPIIHSKENDKIYSIQVDHLVIGPNAVYLIETKNWSKNSVKNRDLYSPVKQMQRHNYAIFVILNRAISNRDIKLSRHHWGDKKINVKNILLMIGAKTSQEFQFVKMLTLSQLNKHICYFDDCFSRSDVLEIQSYLMNFQDNLNHEYDDDLDY